MKYTRGCNIAHVETEMLNSCVGWFNSVQTECAKPQLTSTAVVCSHAQKGADERVIVL